MIPAIFAGICFTQWSFCFANREPASPAVSVNFEEDRLDPIQQAYTNFDDMDPDECDFVPTSGTPSSALLLRSHGFHETDEAGMSLDTSDLEESSELWGSFDEATFACVSK